MMIEMFLTVVAGFVLLLFVCYTGGLYASRGWHKGKREYVSQLIHDSIDQGENRHGKRSPA